MIGGGEPGLVLKSADCHEDDGGGEGGLEGTENDWADVEDGNRQQNRGDPGGADGQHGEAGHGVGEDESGDDKGGGDDGAEKCAVAEGAGEGAVAVFFEEPGEEQGDGGDGVVEGFAAVFAEEPVAGEGESEDEGEERGAGGGGEDGALQIVL